MLTQCIEHITIQATKGKKDLSRKVLLNNKDQVFVEIPDLKHSDRIFINVNKGNKIISSHVITFERPVNDFMIGATDDHQIVLSVNLSSVFIKITEMRKIRFSDDYKSIVGIEAKPIIRSSK